MILTTVLAISFVETSKLADKISFIANMEFVHEPTAVIWWRCDPYIVSSILKSYEGSVITVGIGDGSTTTTKNNSEFSGVIEHKQIIFFAADPEEYDYFLKNFNRTTIYPIRMLLVLTVPVKESSYLEKYTKISLDNSVSDVLIISANDADNIMLTTYMPYGPNGCENYTPVVLNSDATNLFTEKFTNFYGCPITLIIANSFPFILAKDNDTDNIRGVDMDILDIVFKKINSSMDKCLRNLTGNQVFEFVANGIYDICLPGIILNDKRLQRVQASDVFRSFEVVMCAPNRREIYAWAKVLLPLFKNTTPLIVLSFLLFMGSVVLTKRFGRYPKNVSKGIIFGTLGLFLGQEIKFETKYWLNNGLFMLWIWYCTIVRIAYQGDLVDGLQKPFLEPHLKTGGQALQVLDAVGGPEGLLLNLKKTFHITKKVEIMLWKDIPGYIKQISNGRRFLLVTDISLIHYSPYKVQMLDQRLSNLPQVLYMRPRWGAAKELNRRMVQLFEGGIVSKIVKAYEVQLQTDTSLEGIEPLTMTKVSSCFIGLVIMNLLWSIVLCIEIVWYKFMEKKSFRVSEGL